MNMRSFIAISPILIFAIVFILSFVYVRNAGLGLGVVGAAIYLVFAHIIWFAVTLIFSISLSHYLKRDSVQAKPKQLDKWIAIVSGMLWIFIPVIAIIRAI